jgi:hypothetical protein
VEPSAIPTPFGLSLSKPVAPHNPALRRAQGERNPESSEKPIPMVEPSAHLPLPIVEPSAIPTPFGLSLSKPGAPRDPTLRRAQGDQR